MEHAYRTFSRGWVPDADAINADPAVLLRADNLTLDELGALVLRQGMTCINPGAPLSDIDINSLFSVIVDGVKVRYAGAGNNVYRNAVTPLGPTFDGTGDIAFGSHLGRVLMARGTAKYKHDGTSISNWGIEMTGGTPTAEPLTTDLSMYASFDSSESADYTLDESNGDAATYTDGYEGSADGALVAFPNVDTGRLVVTRLFGSDEDFVTLDGGWEATDDDIINLFIWVSNPNVVIKTVLQIDVNGGEFNRDFYIKEWAGQGRPGPDGSVSNPGEPAGTGPVDQGPGEVPLV